MTVAKGTPRYRVSVDGGEARLFSGAVTGLLIEVELDGRLYETDYDPRDTGAFVFVGFHAWTSPADEIIDARDRARLIDAIWQLCSEACGVDALLEYFTQGSERFYVMRKSSNPERLLVSFGGRTVEILRLERTVLVLGREGSRVGGKSCVLVDASSARAVYPPGGPTGESAWAEVRDRLAHVRFEDWFLTDHPWRFADERGVVGDQAP